MKDAIHYVGLDVHKETIAVALCDPEGRVTSLGTIPHHADAVARLMRKLQHRATLKVCYEAGCCGYVLQRQLSRMGIDCVVVAPSLIPVKSGGPSQDRPPGRPQTGSLSAGGRADCGVGSHRGT